MWLSLLPSFSVDEDIIFIFVSFKNISEKKIQEYFGGDRELEAHSNCATSLSDKCLLIKYICFKLIASFRGMHKNRIFI